MAVLALTVYGFGKTFFWPTMLAVASDRFPKTGAIAISIMGGIGMMSAGLIGAPGLGYLKDRYSGEALQEVDPELYAQYKADAPSKFLFLPAATGLDPGKLGQIGEELKQLRAEAGEATPADLPSEQATVMQASIEGDRRTLRTDAYIPLTMAVVYLGLLIYFKTIGGYRPVHIDGEEAARAEAEAAATAES
jgi:hypothetical protein